MGLRRKLLLGGVTLLCLAVLFVFVLPTRTYLAQRRDLHGVTERLDVLSAENKRLQDQADKLQTDAEIERLARERYGLVRPGEKAYAILPPQEAPPSTTTTTAP